MPGRLNCINKTIIVGMSMIALRFYHPAQSAEEKKPQLCQGNYQTEEAAKEQLAKFARSYSNLEQWKTRAETIRECILRGAELLPLPEKVPAQADHPQQTQVQRLHDPEHCIRKSARRLRYWKLIPSSKK